MKQDKLFEECLSKVNPEIRADVRRQMNFALIGLPTDDEIQDEAIKHPSPANYQSGARWMRDIAAQKLKEQKQIDDDYLADIKLMRDEYYCELQRLRQEKVEWLEKACRCLEKYMERLGYIDEWCRSGEDDFCKAMEE